MWRGWGGGGQCQGKASEKVPWNILSMLKAEKQAMRFPSSCERILDRSCRNVGYYLVSLMRVEDFFNSLLAPSVPYLQMFLKYFL